jgi:hypothetical protein
MVVEVPTQLRRARLHDADCNFLEVAKLANMAFGGQTAAVQNRLGEMTKLSRVWGGPDTEGRQPFPRLQSGRN